MTEEFIRKQVKKILSEAKVYGDIDSIKFSGARGRPSGTEELKEKAESSPDKLLKDLGVSGEKVDNYDELLDFYEKIFNGPSPMSDAGTFQRDGDNIYVAPSGMAASSLLKYMWYCLKALKNSGDLGDFESFISAGNSTVSISQSEKSPESTESEAEAGPETEPEEDFSTIDKIQAALDAVGLSGEWVGAFAGPGGAIAGAVVGGAADIASGLISLKKGKPFEAMISFVGAIPVVGTAAGVTKMAIKSRRPAFKLISKQLDKISKTIEKAKKPLKAVKDMSDQEKKKRLGKAKENIEKFGITGVEPEQALDLLDTLQQGYGRFAKIVSGKNKPFVNFESSEIGLIHQEYKNFVGKLQALFM